MRALSCLPRPPASTLLLGVASDWAAAVWLPKARGCSPHCPAPLACPAEPALTAWVNNVADPLLSFDAKELIEALAAIPVCLPSLQVG